MYLTELNTVNTEFIRPYFDNMSIISYCHREEIAQPSKLLAVCHFDISAWGIYASHVDSAFYSAVIPWNATYHTYGYVATAQYFRVLTRAPSMFNIIKTLSTHTDDEEKFSVLVQWFKSYKGEAFLVSHMVVEDVHENRYMNTLSDIMYLDHIIHESDDEMQLILHNRCYTICDGMTLMIALIRTHVVPADMGKRVLECCNTPGELLQDYYHRVHDRWASLYYGQINIADYPSQYASRGPDFVDTRILDMFFPVETEPLTIPIVQINLHSLSVTLAMHHSIMVPNFNIAFWTMFQSGFKYMCSDMSQNIAVTDDNTNVIRFVNIDSSGIILSFTTDEGYVYWQHSHSDILSAVLVYPATVNADTTRLYQYQTKKRVMSLIYACLHYFKYIPTLRNPNPFRARVRQIWTDILSYLNSTFNKELIMNVVATMCVLQGALQYNRLYEEIATQFIQDVFDIVGAHCTNTLSLRGCVSRNVAMRIQIRIPTATLESDVGNESIVKYHIVSTLLDICKTNTNIAEFLTGIATTNLILYRKLTDQPQWNRCGHIVYGVLTDYIQRNKHILYTTTA